MDLETAGLQHPAADNNDDNEAAISNDIQDVEHQQEDLDQDVCPDPDHEKGQQQQPNGQDLEQRSEEPDTQHDADHMQDIPANDDPAEPPDQQHSEPEPETARQEEASPAARIARLEEELERVTEEKNALESQYRSLLGKITNMRNTLGDKLRQDADELDRREQQIINLQASNDDLQETVETLKNELIASNEDADRLHTQVEQLRTRADDSAKAITDEASAREAQLREVTEDLERSRLEREDWENQAMKERVERESLETDLNSVQREVSQLRLEKQQLKDERDREAESASNLHAVLEEFQATKDRELKATLGDIQMQLRETSKGLVEYRQRAQAAETKLAETQSESARTVVLEKEVREKNLHIGKLRHEAVILNEHLTEALRRLKKDSGENNVDRRLVTNVLISFFNTPRADSKRFEMLSLLASILSWSDEDRERAGLQRLGNAASGSSAANGSSGGKPNVSIGSSRRRALSRATSAFTRGRSAEESISTEAEGGLEQSFSNLWVEYLLKEAQAGSPPPLPSGASTSTSTSILPPLSNPTSPLPSSSSTFKSISPSAELALPTSPSSSMLLPSLSNQGAKMGPPAPPISRSRSDTANSESTSVFSKGDASSTAPTSIASGYR